MYCPECSNQIEKNEITCPYCGCELDDTMEMEIRRPRVKAKTIVIICAAVVLLAAAAFLVLRILYFAENPRPRPETEISQEYEYPVPPDGPPEFPVGGGAQQEQAARVSAAGGLRMREGPSTDYDIIVLIPNYEYVTILEEEGGWALVEHGSASGWVSTEFLLREDDPRFLDEPVEHNVTPGTRNMNPASARINADGGLRMRMGPGADYHVVMVIPNETVVLAHDESDGWVYVEHLGHWGWVSADFLLDE